MKKTRRPWQERDWVIARALYDIVGPNPPGECKNKMLVSLARTVDRSPDSMRLRLLNFANIEGGFRNLYGGKGAVNLENIRFWYHMPKEYPLRFRRILTATLATLPDAAAILNPIFSDS